MPFDKFQEIECSGFYIIPIENYPTINLLIFLKIMLQKFYLPCRLRLSLTLVLTLELLSFTSLFSILSV